MAYLYVLNCQNVRKKYYIGSTNDISRRVKEHQQGKVIATKGLLPVKLVFSAYFDDLVVARRLEKRLKKLKRRDYLEKIIADGKISLTFNTNIISAPVAQMDRARLS